MSTFDGYIAEFPHIRIDRFVPLKGKPAPLAGFLSHVHSDHLIGLESLKAPFVYCSSATMQLVLKLEKFPHRMNFSKGILERRKQTYKHLRKLLKPLPLNTPVELELCPGNIIRVTLLDANHCLGAVMFLIEGSGTAILYTGDIRSETWWISSLVRNPSIIQYTSGHRHLDKIYLDTTFAVKQDRYKEFPSKAEGVRELLDKVSRYPSGTVFYFNAWTFGYEEVWLALSQALKTKIHLDPYRHALYTSIGAADCSFRPAEASSLCGFTCGNRPHPGILTTVPDNDNSVLLHSCERGIGCPVIEGQHHRVVSIIPCISRHGGMELHELGAGGGHGDLDQNHELDLSDSDDVDRLASLCSSQIEESEVLDAIRELLKNSHPPDGPRLPLDGLKGSCLLYEQGGIPLAKVPGLLASLARNRGDTSSANPNFPVKAQVLAKVLPPLPMSITFPYSRHSSYGELRELVAAFKPKDGEFRGP